MTLMYVRECETVYLEMPLWCDIVFLGGGCIRSFLLVKIENSTCELAFCVTSFSLLVLCVCCER